MEYKNLPMADATSVYRRETDVYRWARLRFSFFMRLRCHFQRIWPFFFQRRELLFIFCLLHQYWLLDLVFVLLFARGRINVTPQSNDHNAPAGI